MCSGDLPTPVLPGFYEPFRRSFNRLVGNSAGQQVAATSVLAGAASGVVGGALAFPQRNITLPNRLTHAL